MTDISEIKREIDRKGRFIDGYDPVDVLFKLLVPFFGDTNLLQRFGLIKHFGLLKTKIIDDSLIKLIIYGANIDDSRDRIIDTYPTKENTEITLSVKSICSSFLADHISQDRVDSLLNSN